MGKLKRKHRISYTSPLSSSSSITSSPPSLSSSSSCSNSSPSPPSHWHSASYIISDEDSGFGVCDTTNYLPKVARFNQSPTYQLQQGTTRGATVVSGHLLNGLGTRTLFSRKQVPNSLPTLEQTNGHFVNSYHNNHHNHHHHQINSQLTNQMPIVSAGSTQRHSSSSASGTRNSQNGQVVMRKNSNSGNQNVPHQNSINTRIFPYAYPARSKNGKYELKILSQPEEQHRARYLTEGSRGAIKDKSGHGYPVVKLCGYMRQPLKIQCFIGHDKHIGTPHLFYQASKIAGKNSTTCTLKKIDGTSVISMEASPTHGMELNVDCIGILKERNVDVEQKLNKFQSGGQSQSVANIKRSTRCRLVFRCEIPETCEVLQTVSTPILCTQPLGTPEINKKSLSHCIVDGGEELYIIGKNFLKDAKVIFRNEKWIKIVEPNREYLKSTHLICKIPPYDAPISNEDQVIEVVLMVKSGGKCSDPQKFYYRLSSSTCCHLHQSSPQSDSNSKILDMIEPKMEPDYTNGGPADSRPDSSSLTTLDATVLANSKSIDCVPGITSSSNSVPIVCEAASAGVLTVEDVRALSGSALDPTPPALTTSLTDSQISVLMAEQSQQSAPSTTAESMVSFLTSDTALSAVIKQEELSNSENPTIISCLEGTGTSPSSVNAPGSSSSINGSPLESGFMMPTNCFQGTLVQPTNNQLCQEANQMQSMLCASEMTNGGVFGVKLETNPMSTLAGNSVTTLENNAQTTPPFPELSLSDINKQLSIPASSDLTNSIMAGSVFTTESVVSSESSQIVPPPLVPMMTGDVITSAAALSSSSSPGSNGTSPHLTTERAMMAAVGAFTTLPETKCSTPMLPGKYMLRSGLPDHDIKPPNGTIMANDFNLMTDLKPMLPIGGKNAQLTAFMQSMNTTSQQMMTNTENEINNANAVNTSSETAFINSIIAGCTAATQIVQSQMANSAPIPMNQSSVSQPGVSLAPSNSLLNSLANQTSVILNGPNMMMSNNVPNATTAMDTSGNFAPPVSEGDKLVTMDITMVTRTDTPSNNFLSQQAIALSQGSSNAVAELVKVNPNQVPNGSVSHPPTSTVLENQLATQQSNICTMSKMTDAELIDFINPDTFDSALSPH